MTLSFVFTRKGKDENPVDGNACWYFPLPYFSSLLTNDECCWQPPRVMNKMFPPSLSLPLRSGCQGLLGIQEILETRNFHVNVARSRSMGFVRVKDVEILLESNLSRLIWRDTNSVYWLKKSFLSMIIERYLHVHWRPNQPIWDDRLFRRTMILRRSQCSWWPSPSSVCSCLSIDLIRRESKHLLRSVIILSNLRWMISPEDLIDYV